MSGFRTNRGDGLMVAPMKPIKRFPAQVYVMASMDNDTIVVTVRPVKAIRLAGSILGAAVQAVLINVGVLRDTNE